MFEGLKKEVLTQKLGFGRAKHCAVDLAPCLSALGVASPACHLERLASSPVKPIASPSWPPLDAAPVPASACVSRPPPRSASSTLSQRESQRIGYFAAPRRQQHEHPA